MFKIAKLEPKPIQWWISQRNKIDMNPPYQRHGRLWSKADKAFLIDSILNEYDIPKIYIADFTFGNYDLNSKGLPYAIIDGKQRFEAIFDFYSGTLRLDDEFRYEQNSNIKLNGLGYSDLSNNYPEIADVFRNYPLSVVHIITNDEEKINELFIRLNRSKPLTGAEIRNAMSGPVPQIARSLSEHELFQTFIKFTTRRGQDRNAITKLLFFEYSEGLVETKRSNLDKFVELAKKGSKEKLELASRRVRDILDRMSTIFLPGDPLLRSAGIFPIYYWFVREIQIGHEQHVREFLYDFEKRRKENREKAGKGSNKIDNELMNYDRFNRSTDDQRSHEERYKILMSHFSNYLQTKKKSKLASN